MSLPSLSKTWQYNLNQRLTAPGSGLACSRGVMLRIVNNLIGFATNPWTIIGSSDSSTSGMDGVNRWAVITNLVWQAAGVAHSWIVLQQAGINSKFQVLIDLSGSNSNGNIATILISPTAGFGTVNGGTNGSNTTRPTATDEITVVNGTLWCFFNTGTAVNEDILINSWQSTDGQVTRILIRRPSASSFCAYIAFEKPKNPVSAWTNPCLACWTCDTTSGTGGVAITRYAVFNDAAIYIGNKPGGGSMTFFLSTEGTVSSMLGELVTTINDLTLGYQLTPIGLISTTTGARGRHGEVFDLWYGPTTLQDGDTYPADGSKQIMQATHLGFTWDGSSPVMS